MTYPLCNLLLSLSILLNLQIPPRRKPMNLILININFTLPLPLKHLLNLLNIPRRKILIQRPNMNLQWLIHLLHVFRNRKDRRMTGNSCINTRFRSGVNKLNNRPTSPTKPCCSNFFVLRV